MRSELVKKNAGSELLVSIDCCHEVDLLVVMVRPYSVLPPSIFRSLHAASRKWLVYLWRSTRSPSILPFVGFSVQLSKWCLYGPLLKDNKAREQAGTREIMQSIPDLAHEIPIRNFILRFRPRSSEFLSARYTEQPNLVTWIISWITRSKWLPGPLGAPVHVWSFSFSCRFLLRAGRTSALKSGKNLKQVSGIGAHDSFQCRKGHMRGRLKSPLRQWQKAGNPVQVFSAALDILSQFCLSAEDPRPNKLRCSNFLQYFYS